MSLHLFVTVYSSLKGVFSNENSCLLLLLLENSGKIQNFNLPFTTEVDSEDEIDQGF